MTEMGLQELMIKIGTSTMQFWPIALMVIVVLLVLAVQMSSVFFRFLLLAISGFWAFSVYLVYDKF